MYILYFFHTLKCKRDNNNKKKKNTTQNNGNCLNLPCSKLQPSANSQYSN